VLLTLVRLCVSSTPVGGNNVAMDVGASPDPEPGHAQTFVGRKAEMRRLLTSLDLAGRGRPGMVLVRADAGVGKSRLLRQFVAQARDRGALVLWGACIALASGEIPYAPLIDGLRRLTRELGHDAVREVVGPSYFHLDGLIVGGAGGSVAPGPRPEGPADRTHLFGALLELLDRLSQDRPVVLVLEDLHWADQSTLDVLTYLARSWTGEHLLVVGSQRTSELHPGHPLHETISELKRAHALEFLDLSEFSGDELRDYLQTLMDAEVTHDLLQRAHELTLGNALFLEEVVAAGTLTQAVDGEALLPPTADTLLRPRLERLGDDAREVIGVAAAVGRQASHRLLDEVCELPEHRLLAALRECVRQGLLTTRGDMYIFHHPLLREVAYGQLIPGDRLRLHRAIALALTADPDLGYGQGLTVAAELSYHWSEARAFPESLAAAVEAGDHAMQVLAFREASRQFDRALRVWPKVPDAHAVAGMPRYRLSSKAADAARWCGRLDHAVELASSATHDVDRAAEPVTAGELFERLGSYLWESGRHSAAKRAYADAVSLLRDTAPSAVAARVLAVHATNRGQNGFPSEGLELGRAAVRMAAQVGARAAEGRALNSVGLALALLDRVEEGVEALQQAQQIADEGGHLEDLYRAYGNLVFILEHAGQLERAVAVAVEGLSSIQDAGLGHTRGRAVLENNLCEANVQLGRWDEAVTVLERILRDQPDGELLFPRLTLAIVKVGRGEFAEAQRLLDKVRDGSAAVGQPWFVAGLHACAAELAIWQHQPDAARQAVRAGLAALADGDSPLESLRLCALGMRNEADEARRIDAMPRRARADLRPASSTMDELVGWLERLSAQVDSSKLTEIAVLLDLCRAESARADGKDSPERWAALAERWEELRRPYPVAYALWRAADADARAHKADRGVHTRDKARSFARGAHEICGRLGATPLRSAIEDLARSARLDLTVDPPGPEKPTSKPASDRSRLTRRELEVLALVTAGWSNRQIATKLFITEKTASVHVSNIMQKLGASRRAEVAHKVKDLGLKA
jgi:ATP/maltotriose-dependent transcriptional regulator MalT